MEYTSYSPVISASLASKTSTASTCGIKVIENVRGDANGHFVSRATLRHGDRARVVVEDAWGDTTGTVRTVSG